MGILSHALIFMMEVIAPLDYVQCRKRPVSLDLSGLSDE